jgi:2-(1,2-epoxy-1,2-dihydrophenyl)acetyl-CoA isomerase
MADENTQISVDGPVATITLNRPALTSPVKDELRAAVEQVAGDAAIRVVVLTGSGKAFCVGQDLAEHAEALRADPSTAFATIHQHYNPIVTALAEMPKPVIAAINGTCVGAGLGFALACDLRVAAAGVRFGTAFTGIGLTCDSGLSASLVRTAGATRAAELILLAATFTAEQALDWGIVNSVVAKDDLAQSVSELAARLAAGPTLAYAEAKRAIAMDWRQTLAHEAEAQARLGLTQDHRNAVGSFLAKRPAEFTGA